MDRKQQPLPEISDYLGYLRRISPVYSTHRPNGGVKTNRNKIIKHHALSGKSSRIWLHRYFVVYCSPRHTTHTNGHGMEYYEKHMFETRYWGEGEKKSRFWNALSVASVGGDGAFFLDRFIGDYQRRRYRAPGYTVWDPPVVIRRDTCIS